MELATFQQLLAAAVKAGASDIHLKPESSPALRVSGNLIAVRLPALTPADTARVVEHVLGASGWQGDPRAVTDIDTSYALADVGRFRVAIYRAKNHRAVVLRVIPPEIPTIEQLALPPVVASLCELERGMVLVTGATGSGKSSTLAAMVGHINARRRCHVLTIEDPIEFVHADGKARISQREVGTDCADFATALRNGLRQDPDVILVGEMRDSETVDTALKAAETGHLVLSTLHTTDAGKTVARLTEFYPPEAAAGVRYRIAESLSAVLSQRLLPRAKGHGRIVAVEAMVMTDTLRKMIVENRIHEIPPYLEANAEQYGSQTFDQHLLALFKNGDITQETAVAAATRPNDLIREIEFPDEPLTA